MKKNIAFLLCMVLLLLMLPAFALAGDSCTEGIHDLDMVDVKYPTCETDGYMILECRNCNYQKTEIVNELQQQREESAKKEEGKNQSGENSSDNTNFNETTNT